MTTLREAAQMALDAMLNFSDDISDDMFESIRALRAALAQPEPEPVAWWHDRGDVVDLNVSGHGTPLYFNPPQREWQGLTDEEKLTIVRETDNPVDALAATEAKLKEKNGL